ncbi:MAG: alpha-L-fucosidase, partial [Verrucomicrobiales bacterium]|nr:alpha-L-fucosidase [Verrucomicrobiales bacterium]
MNLNLPRLLTLLALAWAVPSRAENASPHADWFSRAKLGVFMHFLPSGQAGLEQVRRFDVPALAAQLHDMGAGYLIFTLGQNSGYLNSPNAAYEKRTGYAPGERCSTRDLPLELHQALQTKGIRLMLYLPCQTPNEDARAQKAFGLPEGAKDQPLDLAFAEKWSEVIQEWSDRYGDKVAGWWFDGGYQHIHFNEAIAARYAAAAKHGNPRSLVTFNPGVRVIRWTQAENYTAGELNEPLQTLPTQRWLEGSQWHALTYLGDGWGRRNTRFTDTQWADWARKVAEHQGVITLDVGPNLDAAAGPIGQIADAQARQVKAIRAALRGSAETATPPRRKRADSFFGVHF